MVAEMHNRYSFIRSFLLMFLFSCFHIYVFSQVGPPADSLKADSLRIIRSGKIPPAENLDMQYDVGDLFRNVFHRNKGADPLRNRSGITIIPNIAANPSIGFQVGIKSVAGLKLGKDPRTLMSVGATSASITTKGIILFYLNHNIFTNANKWNLQGNIVGARNVIPDYGVGIGRGKAGSEEENVLGNAGRREYVINGLYFIFREKIFKE